MLHRRGKLHRDIKPSNVLVTPEGRVVILDFGLIAELLPQHAAEVSDVKGGTLRTCRPRKRRVLRSKQGTGTGGMTLYEALRTCRSPVRSPTCCSPRDQIDPPAPSTWCRTCPPDLSAVCMGLLRRDPEQRLSGPAALRRLLQSPSAGRCLRDSRHPVRWPRSSALPVERRLPRGRGRSAARCRSSARRVSARARWYGTLSARSPGPTMCSCFPGAATRTSPFLSRRLMGSSTTEPLPPAIPRQDVETLLPPDVAALTRVFPVLLQVRPSRRAAGSTARERRSVGPAAARVRRAAGTARAHREPAAARRLDRRPAVGRRGQRRPARGSPVAAVHAGHAHAIVFPQ